MTLTPGTAVELDERAAHYITKVLRLRQGSAIRLFDGCGNEVSAVIRNIARKSVLLDVGERINNAAESKLEITLLLGLSRTERMDYAIQKAVELGVSCIQPLLSEYAAFHPKGAQVEKKMQHWQGVIISACEQCGRASLPVLGELQSLSRFISGYETQAPTLGLLFSPGAGRSLHDVKPEQGRLTLAVGPEGGLSSGEEQQLEAAGFQPVRLGPRILRTETAAVAVLTAAQLLWGDLV